MRIQAGVDANINNVLDAGEVSSTAYVCNGLAAPAGGATATQPLNDTGIIAAQCYQAGSNVLAACSGAGALSLSNRQDGGSGRDVDSSTNSAADGKLGFNFTKLSAAGADLAPGAPAWDCVRDNTTGLVWENKAAAGLRAGTNNYTNLNNAAATDTSGFVAAVNAATLCGASDWRLPNISELQSLVDYSVATVTPRIDETWFPNTPYNEYWTSTPDALVAANAWFVDLIGGLQRKARTSVSAVRLVRGAQSTPALVASANGQEVRDNRTGLVWRRCVEGMNWNGSTCAGAALTFTHEAALQHAQTQGTVTGLAWRVPNAKEVSSIADRTATNPAIDATAFPGTPLTSVWSSTPVVADPSLVWVNAFSIGVLNNGGRSSAVTVRLVRNGP